MVVLFLISSSDLGGGLEFSPGSALRARSSLGLADPFAPLPQRRHLSKQYPVRGTLRRPSAPTLLYLSGPSWGGARPHFL